MVNISINSKQKLLTVNNFINGKWLLWTANDLDIFPKNKLLLLLAVI